MQHGAQQEQPPPPAPRPQQNVIDPNLVHKNVIEMFPELDLTEIIQRFGHATSEQLASLIIDRMAQIPKKRGTKRRATENIDDDHPAENTFEESYASIENDEDLGDLLIDKFLATLIRKIKSELRQLGQNGADAGFDYFYKQNKRNFIMNQFCGVRAPFIDQMLNLFDYFLVPTSIACFFAENNFSNKLQKMIPGLSQGFWLNSGPPLKHKRKPHLQLDFPQNIWTEFGRYLQLMHNYRDGDYAELLTEDLKLTQQFNQIRWERPGPEEKIECLVCYEQFPLRRMTYCSAPKVPQHTFLANQSASLNKENKTAPKMDKPGTSNAAGILEEELETSIIDVGEEEDTDPSTHPFCRDCIRGQAQAATEQQPLAEGGVGLCCMVPNCKNPILYSDIRSILSKEICKKLDERIAQENVAKALLSNLERCKRCNYAVQMEVDKKVNKVFHCFQCDAEFCRICENDWNDEHFGIGCEELEQKLQRERKDRNLEKQLNEAIIRKCPSCGVAFMKDQGCNKMTCRCGMTMCYICRAQKIDYTHFCQHLRDPGNPNWKCKDCNKTCFLYEDALKKDEQLIAKIRQEAVDGEANAQQSTSKFQHIQKYPPSPYPQAMLRRMNNE